MQLSMELVREYIVLIQIYDKILLRFFVSGKDKLAEILSMDSNAAKEVMTSFLRESTRSSSICHSV